MKNKKKELNPSNNTSCLYYPGTMNPLYAMNLSVCMFVKLVLYFVINL